MSEDLDLEKIAEFMNSEPEQNVDLKEVENTIEYIDNHIRHIYLVV